MRGGVQKNFHTFLISPLDTGERPALRCGCFLVHAGPQNRSGRGG
jgi:hypothetical protein